MWYCPPPGPRGLSPPFPMTRRSRTRRFSWWVLVYCLTLCWLALRLPVPHLNGPIPSFFSIGAWNMYHTDLAEEVSLYVSRDDDPDSQVPIDWRKFLYHSTFASSSHPNFYPEMGDGFVRFVDDHSKLLAQLRAEGVGYSLILKIDLIQRKRERIEHQFMRTWKPKSR